MAQSWVAVTRASVIACPLLLPFASAIAQGVLPFEEDQTSHGTPTPPRDPLPLPRPQMPQTTFQQPPLPPPQPPMPSPQRPSIGFGAPAPGPQSLPSQPVRQNYADELTDFGVPPQSMLRQQVGSETPTTIPGGHVITTNEMRQAIGTDLLLFDVWQAPPHPSVPGAVALPGAGAPGTFDDDTQQRLWTALSQATNHQANRPIVFFCTGSRCWESYNAALRALRMGFTTVLWYRGGLAAWQASGGRMVTAQSGGSSAPGRIGFGQ